MIEQARRRSEMYATLAAGFDRPQAGLVSPRWFEVLDGAPKELSLALPQEELAELQQAVAGLEGMGLARLSAEHTRLFEGPGRPVIYPYEGFHRRDNLDWVEVAAQVGRAYAAAGLGLADGFRDLPDHIVAELEFMAYLWTRQAQALEELRWETAAGFLALARAFLREHLGLWFLRFCQEVLSGTSEPFYLAMASFSRRFILGEMAQAEPRSEPVTAWELGLNKEGCTLCEACALGCPTGALRLAREGEMVGLAFRAASCDGCRRCLELCPMGLIYLIPAQGGLPSEGERWLVRSALAHCSRCGQVLGAEATWTWVRQRLAGMPGAETVSLCFQCRSEELVRSSFR